MTRQQLIQQIFTKRTFLCVGLDTDVKKIPHPYCVAYKPNLAFYEAHGVAGWIAYERTIHYLNEHYPDHFVIADAKRGDIGNTSAMYARTFFEGDAQVDALTVAPYMGEDSVTPFLGYPGHWVILLALTSNKGSHDFQMAQTLPLSGGDGGGLLFEQVLLKSQEWGTPDNMMYVVGATQGRLFADIRRIVPHHFLLVPGVGAQGGSLDEVCRYGMTADCGLLVNSSRAIIYADSSEHFAEVAAQKAKEMHEQMATLLPNN